MKTEKTENGTVELWTAQEVADARNDIVLIDVRTPQEHGLERISGAMLMALQEFRPDCLPGQVGRRIVLHCGSGVRSGKAAQKCLEPGSPPSRIWRAVWPHGRTRVWSGSAPTCPPARPRR